MLSAFMMHSCVKATESWLSLAALATPDSVRGLLRVARY